MGGPSGFDDVEDDDISGDPVMRLWQREIEMEMVNVRGVRDLTGTWVRCDDEGQKVLEKRGWKEGWRGRWLTACAHMAHAFTHAAACDASLQTDEKGRRGVGIGIWMGVQPSVEGSTRHTIAERVGSGMWGMACPSNWQIADAEMYAILRYLRHVAQQSAEDQSMLGQVHGLNLK